MSYVFAIIPHWVTKKFPIDPPPTCATFLHTWTPMPQQSYQVPSTQHVFCMTYHRDQVIPCVLQQP